MLFMYISCGDTVCSAEMRKTNKDSDQKVIRLEVILDKSFGQML